MEALEIDFPHYWLQVHCDELFPRHLVIIKQWYYGLREVQGGSRDTAIVDKLPYPLTHKLDLQTSLFMMMM